MSSLIRQLTASSSRSSSSFKSRESPRSSDPCMCRRRTRLLLLLSLCLFWFHKSKGPSAPRRATSIPLGAWNDVKRERNSSSHDRQFANECLSSFQKYDSNCVRIMDTMRTHQAGLGHQIAELVFSLELSEQSGSALNFKHFDRTRSNHETDGYAFVEELFGLRAFAELSFNRKRLSTVSLADVSSLGCDVFIKGDYESCPGGNCFYSYSTAFAFSRFSPCLRSIGLVYGSWVHRSPFEDVEYFNVVWHVRVGDVALHPPGDTFYEHVLEGLSPVLTDFKRVKIFFLAEWTLLKDGEMGNYTRFLSQLAFNFEVDFVEPQISSALLFMMHADILVGSGSSLPLAAALFSTHATYVNVMPKHGWHHHAEYLSDGITVTESGEVLTHVFTMRKRFAAKTSILQKVKPQFMAHYSGDKVQAA